MSYFKRTISLALAFVAVMIMVSCATERSAVDKSPELALDKHLFEGEFFYKQGVVDLPYTADYSYIGEGSEGAIIKWRIEEKYLVAYNIHDRREVVNTAEETSVNETPVLAYPILMHFDITPTENPTTGEDMPVLTINQDRPWNERRYFQIDMSGSAITNFNLKYWNWNVVFGSPFKREGMRGYHNLEFYANDGSYIEPKEYKNIADKPEKQVNWFQFYSTEYLVKNPQGPFWSMEDLEEGISTEPATITYRNYFKKVNRDIYGERSYDKNVNDWTFKKGAKDNGFRPLEYQDQLFRKFGFFTSTFKGYDPDLGVKDKNSHILANYYNTAWADANKNWNFTCTTNYDSCLSNLAYQQKLILTYSPETPERIFPANCAIALDMNHAFLAARYAAMNPGSLTSDFDAWYVKAFEGKDFFKTINGVKVRDDAWYMDPKWYAKDADGNEILNPATREELERICFIPEKEARIQDWKGDLIVDKHKNTMVAFVRNPVEAYIPKRDGKNLKGEKNAIAICVKENEVEENPTALTYYEDWKMPKDGGCDAGYKLTDAACVLDKDRECKEFNGKFKLRQKYTSGDPTVTLLNWVDVPTEFGILGVANWTINYETGETLGGAANVAGSVLAWVVTRAIEFAQIMLDDNDSLKLDFEKFTNPDYGKRPQIVWDGEPASANKIKTAKRVFDRKTGINSDLTGNIISQEKVDANIDQKNRPVNRKWDFSAIKGTKFEKDLVPYSAKKILFPWIDPHSGSYTEEEKSAFRFWLDGENVLPQEIIKWQAMNSRECYFEEYFLDGALVKYLQEKRAKYKNDKEFLSVITYEIEKLLYKGVAQHELGHTLGLRHNFIGSADLTNYHDAYFHSSNFPALQAAIKAKIEPVQKAAEAEFEANWSGDPNLKEYEKKNFVSRKLAALNEEIWQLKRTFQSGNADVSPMNYYTYTSVMDYQREPYIHAVGLGKYDNAAFKFVYGRSVEQYVLDDSGNISFEDNKIRDDNYKWPKLKNIAYLTKDGKLKTVEEPKDFSDDTKNIWNAKFVPAIERYASGVPKKDGAGNTIALTTSRYLIDDASVHKYLFYSDEKVFDEPHTQRFDAGYKASDMIRQQRDQENAYYYVRFFRRGNDRFSHFRGSKALKMILDTYYNTFKMLHYGLDLSYNERFMGWNTRYEFDAAELEREYVSIKETGSSSDNFAELYSKAISHPFGEEWLRARQGAEYWLDENGNLQETTPLKSADYLMAAYEGVNYLIYDVIYRPDVDVYWNIGTALFPDSGRFTKAKRGVYYKSYGIDAAYPENVLYEMYYDKYFSQLKNVNSTRTDAVMGRYHKDRSDIQDDPETYYEKATRKGFEIQKAVALYTLTNQGWPSGKYMRESMANGLQNAFDTFGGYNYERTMFTILTDISAEDSVMTFSPYCQRLVPESDSRLAPANGKIGAYCQITYNGEKYCPLYKKEFLKYVADPANNPKVYPKIEQPEDLRASVPVDAAIKYSLGENLNLCEMAKDKNHPDDIFVPVHAGWIYFDRLYPLLYGIFNIMNTSADTQVVMKFYSLPIPASEYNNYRPVDVDEVEFFNASSTVYYRAKMPSNYMDDNDKLKMMNYNKCRETSAQAVCLNTVFGTTDADAIRAYLEDKYMKDNPAYKLVKQAKLEKDAFMNAQASDFKLSVYETTIKQLNTFIDFWDDHAAWLLEDLYSRR